MSGMILQEVGLVWHGRLKVQAIFARAALHGGYDMERERSSDVSESFRFPR